MTQPALSCQKLGEALNRLRESLFALESMHGEMDERLASNEADDQLFLRYSEHLAQLSEADTQRALILKDMGLKPEQMRDALASCQSVIMAEQWRDITDRLPDVALRNRKYAHFLRKATDSIQQALSLLGSSTHQPLYGPSGQKEQASGSRQLGSA